MLFFVVIQWAVMNSTRVGGSMIATMSSAAHHQVHSQQRSRNHHLLQELLTDSDCLHSHQRVSLARLERQQPLPCRELVQKHYFSSSGLPFEAISPQATAAIEGDIWEEL